MHHRRHSAPARTRAGAFATSLLLALALAPSAQANGTIGTPIPVDAGLSCKDFDTANILSELVINPLPPDVTRHSDGTLTVDTIHFESTNGWLLYWSQVGTTPAIHSVSISGGGSAMLYLYDPPVTEDAGLQLPAITPLTTITTNTTTSSPIERASFCYSTPGGETGFEGCTLGYWKVKQHHDSWPAPYATSSNLQVYFGPNAFNDTLLAALNYKGGPGIDGAKRILLKQAVAALLNSAPGAVDYPLTTAQVTSQTAAALASDDREVMLSLAMTLDAYNNQGCPLN